MLSWIRRAVCVAVGVSVMRADPGPPLPLALREVHPDKLSGGLFAALDAQGAFGTRPPPARLAARGVDASKGRPPAVLDARVGVNTRLGDDPAPLPDGQRNQAEPHIWRSSANPDVLLATFQDGRFTTSGALSNGYAVSRDGGLTWTRGLTPFLTPLAGGPYFRATDPVAAGGPNGELYLNALASIDGAFGLAAVVVSRSLDEGATWSPPFVIFQAPNGQTAPDKNWMVANDLPAAPNSGRLVATWTNFTSNAQGNATGNNLASAFSDDRGATWSAPVLITPVGSNNQGTQPVFLPDGTLVVVYTGFVNPQPPGPFILQCKRSLDGGRTFPAAATTIVPSVQGWDDPYIRDGVFLPSATVARQTGELFVTYAGVVLGSPRVLVTKSSDFGATWSAPVVVIDQPAGVSVMNPAVTVTPDGRNVSVVFMDKRNASDGANFVDHYAAQSFDGGATWQANLRLSDMSSDIRYGTLTTRGYMLGDYLGVAPALATDQPCVAIWCDTRTGDSDPMTVRFSPLPIENFAAWRVARFSPSEFSAGHAGPEADFDGDGLPNVFEYIWGQDPRLSVASSAFSATRASVSPTRPPGAPAQPPVPGVGVTVPVRLGLADFGLGSSAIQLRWQRSTDGVNWTPADVLAIGGALIPIPTFPGSTTPSPANRLASGDYILSLAGGEGVVFRPQVQLASNAAVIPLAGSDEGIAVGTDSRLVNLSTRGQLLADASQLIGSVVTRGGSRTLLVRGVGPTLAQLVPSLNVAGDPALRFVSLDGPFVAENDDWSTTGSMTRSLIASTATQVGAFPFGSDKEAAVRVGIPAGSYSAQLSNRATSGGNIGLVEIYDASTDPNGLLANLSTRGEVGAGDAALIAGVVIRGTQPRRVLIRAVGPSLAHFNVPGTLLTDPVLTLYQGAMQLATNDDWEISRSSAALAATAVKVGAFALDPASLDAALLITLAPGAYTAVVTSANGTTGIALVEIYDAD